MQQPPHPSQSQHMESVCLRFPDQLGIHQIIEPGTAINMLQRALQLSADKPYVWGYIDKPTDGQLYLLFMPPHMSFPNDGIRWQEKEMRYVLPSGPNRELEVIENKFGFIPNSADTMAYRGRRRFRMHRGGHPQLILVHYFHGPAAPIAPSLFSVPVRQYPLPPISSPPVFVVGDKAGTRVFPVGHPNAGAPMPPSGQQGPGPGAMGMGMGLGGGAMGMPGGMGGMGAGAMGGIGAMGGMGAMGMGDQAAMLARQNASMEALERGRRESAARPPPVREDEDSGDEAEISTRTLAATRYRRNHEWMNEVFMYAAFGDKVIAHQPKHLSEIFDKTELDEKVLKLQAEIDQMQQIRDSRRRVGGQDA